MHTVEEKQFYADLDWMRRWLSATFVGSPAMKEKLKERYERMQQSYHNRIFIRTIDGD